MTSLRAEAVTLGYRERVVTAALDVAIPDDSFTVIVGPNACGKSTLLRGLARLLQPRSGQVLLDGKAISSYPTRTVARRLGLLAQVSTAPEGITVGNLVGRGRFPHQGMFQQWTEADETAVREALEATNTIDLAPRRVEDLSGGQRQRVWVAMALAQQSPTLLLDEPTTFLDIAHQVELMDLFGDLHRQGRTLVAVLHDLNQAARYATHLIAMSDGAVVASGPPQEVVTEALVRDVFGLECKIIDDPLTGTPMVIPGSRLIAG